MSSITLSQGAPLDHVKQLRWDGVFAPRRTGSLRGAIATWLLHPGATHSWKQIQFGEANVQLTFHENDTQRIDGVDCVMLEPDIDYYRDPLAHTILEVIPNGLTHTLTDPVEVYVLRWMAGRMAGVPEFAPLYTMTG